MRMYYVIKENRFTIIDCQMAITRAVAYILAKIIFVCNFSPHAQGFMTVHQAFWKIVPQFNLHLTWQVLNQIIVSKHVSASSL